MAIANVAAQSGTARNTLGGNAAVPCGSMTPGNLVVVCALDDSGTTLPTIPAGFSAALASVANSFAALVSVRMVTAGDTTYNWTSGGIANIAVIYEVFSGAKIITASEVVANTQTGTGSALAYAANTMDSPASASLTFGKAGGGSAISPSTTPSAYTELHDMSGSSITFESALLLAPGAGSLTPGNATIAANQSGRGSFHVEILSAAAGFPFPRRASRGLVIR